MVTEYQIFPNPFKSFFTLKSVNPDLAPIALDIFSREGLLYQKFEFKHSNGNYEYMVDVRSLPPGAYYLLIHSNCGNNIESINKYV
jgi:hypothetical protein